MPSPVTITAKSSSDGISGGAVAPWATQRNATSGSLGQVFIHNCNETGGDYLIARQFLYFDVSNLNIPRGSVIKSINFIHPPVSNRTVNNGGQITLTTHTAADPPVSGSYDDITLNSPTEFCTRVNMTSLNTGSTTTIALNATGVAALQSALTSGLFKLCVRGSLDVDNTVPGSLNEYSATFDNSQLVVSYIPPGGFLLL